jgi:hypothetical protein
MEVVPLAAISPSERILAGPGNIQVEQDGYARHRHRIRDSCESRGRSAPVDVEMKAAAISPAASSFDRVVDAPIQRSPR